MPNQLTMENERWILTNKLVALILPAALTSIIVHPHFIKIHDENCSEHVNYARIHLYLLGLTQNPTFNVKSTQDFLRVFERTWHLAKAHCLWILETVFFLVYTARPCYKLCKYFRVVD